MLPRVIIVSVLKIISVFVEANQLLISIVELTGSSAFLSVLGAHLLFNMKEAGERDLNQGMSCAFQTTVSNIDFAISPAAVSYSQEEIAETKITEREEIC